ncbi:beta-galactosidase [Streptomyces californicus]
MRLLSGALHYFRVHEEQWDHRLAMLAAMGLNCVEMYVPWNLHETREGEVRGVGALGRFLDAAEWAGLWAIVRPGPYICAEWENGGLPVWVMGRFGGGCGPGTRCAWRGGAVVPRAAAAGGAAAGVAGRPGDPRPGGERVGSYGSAAVDLEWLAGLLRRCGVTVPLGFTSGGPEDAHADRWFRCGAPRDGELRFGGAGGVRGAAPAPPKGPLMCMEFWCGWFSHWGSEPVHRGPEQAAGALREILECGASVDL